MTKQAVVLFGAGLGGKRTYKRLREEYDITCFVDNDVNKHGTRLAGKRVISPEELKTLEFEKIFISSMYASEIMYQLRQELGIPPEKIALVPSDVLNGDDEVPWGCLSVIVLVLALAGWGIYSLLT